MWAAASARNDTPRGTQQARPPWHSMWGLRNDGIPSSDHHGVRRIAPKPARSDMMTIFLHSSPRTHIERVNTGTETTRKSTSNTGKAPQGQAGSADVQETEPEAQTQARAQARKNRERDDPRSDKNSNRRSDTPGQ